MFATGGSTGGAAGVRRVGGLGFGATESGRRLRVLTYSHDGFGLGHLRRSLRLASALTTTRPGTSTLTATGSFVPNYFPNPEGVDYLKLPSLSKVANGRYVPRSLSVPPADVMDVRAQVLAAAISSFLPDLVLVDRYPLGLLGELRAGLIALKQERPEAKVVLGLRDVLDDPATVREEWTRGGYTDAVEQLYDRVLIYGSRIVFDAIEAYELEPGVVDRTVYTGYLCDPPQPAAAAKLRARLHANGDRLAVCTLGGGEDGHAVASAFVDALKVLGPGWVGVVVTGPMMPPDRVKALRSVTRGSRIRLRTFVKDLPVYLDACDVVVSMGGYNTLCETLSVAARAVIVPRTHPRVEQAIRSRLFAERGAVHVVDPAELDAGRLAGAMRDALEVPREEIRRRIASNFDLTGLANATHALIELLPAHAADADDEARVIDLNPARALTP